MGFVAESPYGASLCRAEVQATAAVAAANAPRNNARVCGWLVAFPKSITAPRLCALMTPPSDSHDIIDPSETADPMLKAEPTEATEPMLSADPTEPILSTEPTEPMLKIDPSEAMDHFESVMGDSLSARTADDAADRYQMRTRSAGSRHIPSPGCTPKASTKSSLLTSTPVTRYSAGE